MGSGGATWPIHVDKEALKPGLTPYRTISYNRIRRDPAASGRPRERCAMGSMNVHVFNEQNFDAEVLKSDLPVLVDFTATWCGPCKLLAPIVEKLADEFQGKVKVGKLDIDDAPKLTAKYGVRSVPTVLVFRGGEKKGQHVGLTTRDKLVKLLDVG
jgi:thioredoxin 1